MRKISFFIALQFVFIFFVSAQIFELGEQFNNRGFISHDNNLYIKNNPDGDHFSSKLLLGVTQWDQLMIRTNNRNEIILIGYSIKNINDRVVLNNIIMKIIAWRLENGFTEEKTITTSSLVLPIFLKPNTNAGLVILHNNNGVDVILRSDFRLDQSIR
jgi:hypothetical protein